MRKLMAIAAALLVLPGSMVAVGAVQARSVTSDPSVPLRSGIGVTTTVNGLRVTPLEVLADFRCPEMALCVHPGAFTLTVRIGDPVKGKVYRLERSHPLRIHGQYLTLVDVTPGRNPSETIAPEDYRFKFRYSVLKWQSPEPRHRPDGLTAP